MYMRKIVKSISDKKDDSNKAAIRRIDESLFHQVIGLCWDRDKTGELLAEGTAHERTMYLRGVRSITAGVIAVIAFLSYMAWPGA